MADRGIEEDKGAYRHDLDRNTPQRESPARGRELSNAIES
jgi:hypothetical protein